MAQVQQSMSSSDDRDTGFYYLDLSITNDGPDYQAKLSGPNARRVVEKVELPIDNKMLKAVYQDIELNLMWASRSGRSSLSNKNLHTSTWKTIREFGTTLFENVFKGEVYALYQDFRDDAAEEGRILRIELDVMSSELSHLPWEYMFDPDNYHRKGL